MMLTKLTTFLTRWGTENILRSALLGAHVNYARLETLIALASIRRRDIRTDNPVGTLTRRHTG